MNYIKRIAVIGMTQSGSTRIYNLTRILLRMGGYNKFDLFTYGREGIIHKEKGVPIQDKIKICKMHEINNNICKGHYTHVVNTVRDMRDVVSSRIRKLKKLKKYKIESPMFYAEENYKFWSDGIKHAGINIKYEDFQKDPIKSIKEYSEFLGLKLTDEQYKEALSETEKLKNPKFFKNIKGSLMIPQTISNNGEIGAYKKSLKEETIKAIQDKFKDFFEENNYQL